MDDSERIVKELEKLNEKVARIEFSVGLIRSVIMGAGSIVVFGAVGIATYWLARYFHLG